MMPGTPFVNDQLHPVFAVAFAHDLPVVSNQLFHAIRFLEKVEPLSRREVVRVTFAGGAAIVVKGCAKDIPQACRATLCEFLEEAARPSIVSTVRARGDEGKPSGE